MSLEAGEGVGVALGKALAESIGGEPAYAPTGHCAKGIADTGHGDQYPGGMGGGQQQPAKHRF